MKQFWAGILIATCAAAVTLVAVRTTPPAAAQVQVGPGKVQATPLVFGKLGNVEVWSYPVEKGGTGQASMKLGRVDVYDHFIVITALDGTRSVYPHGWYANLRFQAE
jgi:hypothetical protein